MASAFLSHVLISKNFSKRITLDMIDYLPALNGGPIYLHWWSNMPSLEGILDQFVKILFFQYLDFK